LTYGSQAGADRELASNEVRPAGRAAGLCVVIGEPHTFRSEFVEVWGTPGHHSLMVGTNIKPTNVIAHDEDDVWFCLPLLQWGRLSHKGQQNQYRYARPRPLLKIFHDCPFYFLTESNAIHCTQRVIGTRIGIAFYRAHPVHNGCSTDPCNGMSHRAALAWRSGLARIELTSGPVGFTVTFRCLRRVSGSRPRDTRPCGSNDHDQKWCAFWSLPLREFLCTNISRRPEG